MIQVTIIEDDTFISENVATYLQSDTIFESVDIYTTVENFLEKSSSAPTVLLLDIQLPGMSGIEGVFYIKQRYPGTEVLMFTVYDDKERLFKALQAGAVGYLLKSTPLPKLKTAIMDAIHGDAPMSPTIARKVVTYFSLKQKKNDSKHIEGLSIRENQLALLLIDGLTYKQVAYHLFISPDTVRQHIKNIYKKLHINCRTELIKEFHRFNG